MLHMHLDLAADVVQGNLKLEMNLEMEVKFH